MKTAYSIPWLQIRADMLQRIQQGEWAPGEHIPNEVQLAADYACNRSTIGRALRDLAASGFLDRRRKGGTKVAEKPVRKVPLDIPLIAEAIRQQGFDYGYRLLRAALIPAPDFVARALDIEPGLPVLEVRALHLADGQPHQLEYRWVNPQTAKGIETADFTEGGPDTWLLRNAPLSHLDVAIKAIHADADAAVALGVAPGTPLLEMERRSSTQTTPLGLLRLLHRPGLSIRAQL